jgi:hypothetical protein
MPHETYLPSDLSSAKRTQFLREAREGRARLRDKDGTTFVMLPEHELEVLDAYAKWSVIQQRLTAYASRSALPSVEELGELAWIRVFDSEDLAEFADELHGALITGLADQDTDYVDEVVKAWRISARQLEDPLRRAVLTSRFQAADFEEASRPE